MTGVYKEQMTRVKCTSCNFTFFTHYPNSELCASCDPDNDCAQTVRSWED